MSLITLMQTAYDIIQHEMGTRACSSCQEDNDAQQAIIQAGLDSSVVIPELKSNTKSGLTISKEGIVEIGMYEALANQPYLCSANVKTIALGVTPSNIPELKTWPWTKTITDEEAVQMFLNALKSYDQAVRRALKVKVKKHEFDMLVSITYNIGKAGMAGSTFMRRLNAGETPQRVVEAMQWWDKVKGKTVQGLVNRRRAESIVYTTGEYKNDNTVARISVAPMTHKPVYRGRVNIMQYL